MEQVWQEKGEREEAGSSSRMGGEETADPGVLMEEDVEVELDSGVCMETDSELSLAGQERQGSECTYVEEVDLFTNGGRTDFVSNYEEQDEGSTGEDGRSQTQQEVEMDEFSDSEEVKNRKTEDPAEEAEEEENEGVFDVRLWPAEEGGRHVRISLEEVERYYRFSRCCHWLRGR